MTDPKPTTQTTDRTDDESSPLDELSRRRMLQSTAVSAALAAGSGTALAQGTGNGSNTPDEDLVWEEVATPDNPAGIDFDSEGRLWIVNRDGHVDVVDPETGESNTALNLSVYTAGEHGAVGIAVDPDFAETNWIYIFYSPAEGDLDPSFDNGTYNVVSRFEVDGDQVDPNSEEEILRIPAQRELPVHIGGGLDFGPEGALYISLGDNTHALDYHVSHYLQDPGAGSFIFPDAMDEPDHVNSGDSRGTAMDTSSLKGKILRIVPEDDGSYSIPDGNLFPEDEYAAEISDGTVRPEIYAMGFRNPFRIHVDDETGWVFGAGQSTQASDWDANSGPPGLGPVFRFREPGVLGWPMYRGRHPYMRPDSQEDVVDEYSHLAGELYDVDGPINASPRNDGLRELPPIDEEATVAYAPQSEDWETYFSPPAGGPWEVPDDPPGYPDLTDYSPICGTLIRTDDTAVGGLPDEYDGSLIFGMWNNGDIFRIAFDENGDMVALEPFLTDLPNASFTDAAMGPDNCLYLCDWGSQDFDPTDATIYRIDHDSDAEPEIETEYELEGETSGWGGVSPSEIAGEENPTLDLEAGNTYRVEWTNADGIAHNFAIRDEDEEVLVSTEYVDQEGESASVEFTATEEMDHYVCEPHPTSMRGGIGEPEDDDPPEREDNLGEPVENITVEMAGGNQFVPRIAHVEVGGTVTWEHTGGQAHNTVAYHPDTTGDAQLIPDGAEPWESDLLGEGGTYERTFDEAGVYHYVCTPHEASGMVGTVVVGWPNPADEPALEPLPDDLHSSAREIFEEDHEYIRETLESGSTIQVGEYDVQDSDGDGLYDDFDGDGETTHDDVTAFFENINDDAVQNNPEAFDFAGNDEIGFSDVIELLRQA